MRQKRVNYIFDPLHFFIDQNKILIPRAHETLYKIWHHSGSFRGRLSSTYTTPQHRFTVRDLTLKIIFGDG